jgi:hypothetical protein
MPQRVLLLFQTLCVFFSIFLTTTIYADVVMVEEEQSGSDVDDEQQEHDSELPSGHVDLPLPNEWSDDDEMVFEQVPPQIQPRHRAIVPNGEAHPPPVQQKPPIVQQQPPIVQQPPSDPPANVREQIELKLRLVVSRIHGVSSRVDDDKGHKIFACHI